MRILTLHERPQATLARALARFETRFSYPLGTEGRFRIAHGPDYALFLRSLGSAAAFVAEQDGRVVGTLGAAIRRLESPHGKRAPVAYIGNLKLAREARAGLALPRLLAAAWHWARNRAQAAYAVVMDKTAATPAAYTGRAGIPALCKLSEIVIWRLAPPIPRRESRPDRRFSAPDATARACHRQLSRGAYWAWGGSPAQRSELAPCWLMSPDGSACGRLEDTRRAKRLLDEKGTELKAAHLAFFAFREARAGAELLAAALTRCGRAGFPSLFVALPRAQAAALRPLAADKIELEASASIYGAGLAPGHDWHISSSEV